jgi:hypothetical protein
MRTSKPKQWTLGDVTEKFKVYHFEAGEGSNSRLWVDLRWSIKRELFTSIRSNAIDDGEMWLLFERPINNHAVAKRQAFELIAFRTVPAEA